MLTIEVISGNNDWTRILTQELKVGCKIDHKYFGYWTVVSIDDDFILIVFEKDQQLKKIKKDYPHMKVLS